MVVICLGPVCIPLWGLLPVIYALWAKFSAKIMAWWYNTPQPEMECKDGVCTLKRPPGKTKVGDGNPADSGGEINSGNGLKWNRSTQAVVTLESEEEWKEIKNQSKEGRRFVIDFSASWCGPCKQISPVFEELCKSANKSGNNVLFVKVDVDELDSVMSECRVGMLPTFQLYENGSMIQELVGAKEQDLRNMLS